MARLVNLIAFMITVGGLVGLMAVLSPRPDVCGALHVLRRRQLRWS